eukprot:GHVL01022501.1.p1 GENE.GHVL01022501.1~~GHVL01022501.1.p1  ORF type:complete len:129 (-),score=24.45 GHVL01022501.1:1030-1416(-)
MGCIKIKEYKKAIKYASDVLEDDPVNIKALYRKADALLHLDEYDQATTTITDLIQLDSSNFAALDLQRKVHTANQKYKARSKKVVAHMINNIERDPRQKQSTESILEVMKKAGNWCGWCRRRNKAKKL